jgi:CheY-like chemotaxis protein
MRHRVQDILLVSSEYDYFILSADGQLDELMLREFVELNLRHTPQLTRVSTGAAALELARADRRYNLIITSLRVGDMDALRLARLVRDAGLDVPVVLLAYDSQELAAFLRRSDTTVLDRIFLWQGDVRILLAIVNLVEDRWNVDHDTGEAGVQAVIVIEDSIRYYSSFVPAIYKALLLQSHEVAPEGANLQQKLMRAQARPKILLCTTFEEAWRAFRTYEANVLGVISDIEFPKDGRLSREAGVEFARRVRERLPDVPVMLQSNDRENETLARSVGAAFLLKNSPLLLHELQRFMVENFGFGDFVFRLPDGAEVGRAHDLRSLEEQLHRVPAASVAYHAERNHFSKWLKARTEFTLADFLRPRRVSEFETVEALRQHLLQSIQWYRARRNRTIVADFDRQSFDESSTFYRIGGGSLGGKARGLAFVNLLLNEQDLGERFGGVRVGVPPAVVIGTDAFDEFLDGSGLRDVVMEACDERELVRRCLAAELPERVARDLQTYVEVADYPLAVRSSSLLEDSQHQPFAGVYDTYMLPNTHPDPRVRLRHLLGAIKRVYASTFSARAKAYLDATPYRLEEEKMAVVVQKIVGSRHGRRFYPDIAGVARSHNFYPAPPTRSEDGIAAAALGLGAAVVEGESCVRFCPRYPRHVLQFSDAAEAVASSQSGFYALRLDMPADEDPGDRGAIAWFGLDAAERDGTLAAVGSTYSAENDTISDGVSRPGARFVSFAPILKHGLFPLAEILRALLDLGVQRTSTAVEIEFAVNLSTPPGRPKEFGLVQLRPLALSYELPDLDLGELDPSSILCRSASVLGNGTVQVHDVVVVDFHRFERSRSHDVAQAVTRLNADLSALGRPYLLIGVGRWGSRDPRLGIPVTWDQIAGARVIVEGGFRDFKVTPSQGTHFFQNLTAGHVGYFTVNPDAGEGSLDWTWLAAQPSAAELGCVRHLRFGAPVVVRMNGGRNEGVILKPRGHD